MPASASSSSKVVSNLTLAHIEVHPIDDRASAIGLAQAPDCHYVVSNHG